MSKEGYAKMTTEKAIKMIDEYLVEPNNINKEWVEVLEMCKEALIKVGASNVVGGCKGEGNVVGRNEV